MNAYRYSVNFLQSYIVQSPQTGNDDTYIQAELSFIHYDSQDNFPQMPIGQPDLDNFSSRLSLQVLLSRIKLTIKNYCDNKYVSICHPSVEGH